MVTLSSQKQIRAVRNLPFCYLCGRVFAPDDITNHDHVPPESVFAKADRQPLKLKSHKKCNSSFELLDEKIGQLIGLKHGQTPSNPQHHRLKIIRSPIPRVGAVTNLNIDEAVWRWIRGFHAALYQEPFPALRRGSLVTPFPRADLKGRTYEFVPIPPQHEVFVEAIKANRARGNLDGIRCNNNRLVYESIWVMADNGQWFCIFALDVYAWKDLGRTHLPNTGCAGCYFLPEGTRPANSTVEIRSKILIPNLDRLDPFSV
jgi:hypothetical protein